MWAAPQHVPRIATRTERRRDIITSPQGCTTPGLACEPFLVWQIRIRIFCKVDLRSENEWSGLSVEVSGREVPNNVPEVEVIAVARTVAVIAAMHLVVGLSHKW